MWARDGLVWSGLNGGPKILARECSGTLKSSYPKRRGNSLKSPSTANVTFGLMRGGRLLRELDGWEGKGSNGSMSKKGYLPHGAVKCVVFWTLALCISTATLAGILGAWQLLGEEGVSRCVMTAFILACGSVTFLFLNFLFGDFGHELFRPAGPPNQYDPAFGDRLRKAKVTADEEKRSLSS